MPLMHSVVLGLLHLALANSRARPPPRLWVQPATRKVQLYDTTPGPTATSTMNLAAQRGECERAFAVVMAPHRALELRNLKLQFPAVPCAGTEWSVLQQGYMFVNATENLLWSPGAINTSAGWLPEPLLPIAAGGIELVPAGVPQAMLV